MAEEYRQRRILLEGEVVHETAAAYLFRHGGREPVWLPKDYADWDAMEKVMDLFEWLADDRGLT